MGLSLPGRHTLTRGQVVIHSDFALPDEQSLLDDLASCRDELGRELGLPQSDEPIHVYLFEDAQKYETFMRLRRPGFPKRRAGFNETDARLEVYVQWSEHLARDLRHEVVHGYIHSVVPNTPLWLDEGLAEYFEVPSGSAGLNRDHLRRLCENMRDGRWKPDLPRLERLRPGDEMTQDDYAEAWAWVHYLLESGDHRRRELPGAYLRTLRQNGSAQPLSAALARIDSRAADELIMHVQRLITIQ